MTIDKNWQHVVVLGAAGKMGSGISLLLLQEMADMPGTHLTLLDANIDGFDALRKYLRDHLRKYAERNMNQLRAQYAERMDLIDNGAIIDEYVEQAMDRVRCVRSIEECAGAKLVFEAIVEDVDAKAELFKKIDVCTGHAAWYFTNTSSIPLALLQEKSHLEGRLIGFHFYNPPAVQKLLELVVPETIDPELHACAIYLAKRLKKTVVSSKDIAGFIGNGHFMREIIGACQKVRELSHTMPEVEALEVVNRVTQDFLLRPMGIFQLVDYVGIDVCQRIGKIMTLHLPHMHAKASFIDPLIDGMVAAGVLGGQYPDGSQKPGFFRYAKGQPVEIYDLSRQAYVPCMDKKLADSKLGVMPAGYAPWKVFGKDPKRQEKVAVYLDSLRQEKTLGAELAMTFLQQSQGIAHALVADGIAASISDVDTVLQQGFFHLYGVDAPFVSFNPFSYIS